MVAVERVHLRLEAQRPVEGMLVSAVRLEPQAAEWLNLIRGTNKPIIWEQESRRFESSRPDRTFKSPRRIQFRDLPGKGLYPGFSGLREQNRSKWSRNRGDGLRVALLATRLPSVQGIGPKDSRSDQRVAGLSRAPR